jgi:hypothetical protein
LQQASATQHLGATLCLHDVRPLQRSLVTGTGAARSKPLISMWLTGKRSLAPDCQALSLLTLPQLVGAGAVPTSCPQFSIGGELPGRTPPTSAVHPMATGVPPPRRCHGTGNRCASRSSRWGPPAHSTMQVSLAPFRQPFLVAVGRQ